MEEPRDKNIVMKLKKRSYYSVAFIFFTIICFISGCENSFEPFNEEKGFYSIYGTLDLHADTNYIRVKDLNVTLSDDTTQQLDATVTLKNINNGSSEILQDSIINFEGVITHNLYTTAKIREVSEYQVVVDGPEGNSVSINATTPYDSGISIDPGNVKDGCQAQVTILISPVMQVSSLFASVTFSALNENNDIGIYSFRPEMKFTDLSQQGLRTIVLSFRPIDAISKQLNLAEIEKGESPCSVLTKDIFSLSFSHYGPGFTETISDSIKIIGGEGRFIAYYDTTSSFQVPAVSRFIDDD